VVKADRTRPSERAELYEPVRVHKMWVDMRFFTATLGGP
jgi:hypothetical protein